MSTASPALGLKGELVRKSVHQVSARVSCPNAFTRAQAHLLSGRFQGLSLTTQHKDLGWESTLLNRASSLGHSSPARCWYELWSTPTALFIVFHIKARDPTDLALQRPAQQGYCALLLWWRRRWRCCSPWGWLQGHRGLCWRALGVACHFWCPLIESATLHFFLFLLLLRAVGERILALYRLIETFKGGRSHKSTVWGPGSPRGQD